MSLVVHRTWTVRGYEVAKSRAATLWSALSWLEQLRWDWILDPEWGLRERVDEGQFFVVRRQVLQLLAPASVGQLVWVAGRIEKLGRSSFIIRHRIMRLEDHAVVAEARVQGVWLGKNRRLARIPDSVRRLHEPDSTADWPTPPLEHRPKLNTHVEYPQGSVDLSFRAPPETRTVVEQRVLRHSETDGFGHANHTVIAKWASDILRPSQGYRIELHYEQEILEGQRIDICSTDDDRSLTLRYGDATVGHVWIDG